MSYEGSYVFVCPMGHYWTRDVYSRDVESCPVCSMPPEHEGLVDETNGLPYYLSFYVEHVEIVKPCTACGTPLTKHKYIFHKLPYTWECKYGEYVLDEGNIPEPCGDEF